MKLFTKHTAVIARLVLVFIFSASSGVTTVVHICCMSKMDCCDHSPCEGHDTCDLPGGPSSGPSIGSDIACHVNAIVGGITLKSGEAAKDKKSVPMTTAFATITPSLCSSLSRTSGSSHALLSLTSALSPPSVEKCVLDGSLLI